ncbi:hypothetical protein EGH25_10575 [Haladaptatus sp. F3-133]|uniref:DUF6036 domain-containing protein n=1 Tax=Halorutilus salinus TaxID=2487751 RepID=A0A9Q4C5T4_9EURY|nr:DUF6036 family nucleotidyltransferase [Halorutilus salinus]MCX2819793.1 hypothetical protein [Halorutilus salinus]
MSGRESRFGRDRIKEQFEELSNSLSKETTVYLIGGGAMTLRNQKTATKDIDLVVESREVYERICDGLNRFGYSPQNEGDLSQEYRELRAAVILEKGDRRFDIFNHQVAGELILTKEIKERSETVFEELDLNVRMFSNEDIFLFKSVANRPDDMGDMEVLIGVGLDFDIVVKELRRQIKETRKDEFVTSISRKLKRLEEETGIRTDLSERVEEMNEVSKRASEIATLPGLVEEDHSDGLKGMSIGLVETQMEYSREEVEEAVEWLEMLGKIRRESGRLVLVDED